MRSLRHRAEYLALRSVVTGLSMFDVSENMRTVSVFGEAYARASAKRRRRARENIRRAFPEMSPEMAEDLAFRSIRNMFRMFAVDAFTMPKLVDRDTWHRHVSVGEITEALPPLLANTPAIMVTGHVGNWEVLGYTLSLLGFDITALARPLDNPLLYEWLLSVRERHGLRILSKFGASRQIAEVIESGRNLAFIADQNAGDGGIFVPFFDRLASTYKSIGLLAMRYRLPIVVGVARRVGDAFQYRIDAVDVIRPEDWVDRNDQLFYISARFNRALEETIRLAPEQYIWVHRRWKSRPKFERAGKPMPSSLIRKLEALPWMTDESLARIRENSERDRMAGLVGPQDRPDERPNALRGAPTRAPMPGATAEASA